MSDPIGAIYEAFATISDSSNSSQEGAAYQVILDGTKGDEKQKQLAAQFIPKFFHVFPELNETALNAMLDLCEDVNPIIRLNAITGFQVLCKNSPSLIPRIADVLGQLLSVEEKKEQAAVNKVLGSLFDIDAKGAFNGLVDQIKAAEAADVNLAGIGMKFFQAQLQSKQAVIKKDPELQQVLVDAIVKVLTAEPRVSSANFKKFMHAMNRLPLAFAKDNDAFKATQASVLSLQANLDKAFDATDEDFASNFVTCCNLGKDKSAFIKYFLEKILPVASSVPEASLLSVMRAVADAFRNCTASSAAAALPKIYAMTKTVVPNKDEEKARASDEKTNFALAEACLYAVHQLASKDSTAAQKVLGIFVPSGQPSDFSSEQKVARADCIERLTLLQEGAKSHKKEISTALGELNKSISSKDTSAEDKETLILKRKVMVGASAAASTVLTLSEGLTKPIPVYGGAQTNVSWRGSPKANKPQQQNNNKGNNKQQQKGSQKKAGQQQQKGSQKKAGQQQQKGSQKKGGQQQKKGSQKKGGQQQKGNNPKSSNKKGSNKKGSNKGSNKKGNNNKNNNNNNNNNNSKNGNGKGSNKRRAGGAIPGAKKGSNKKAKPNNNQQKSKPGNQKVGKYIDGQPS